MDIRVSLADQHMAEDLASLAVWLRNEPRLAGQVTAIVPPPRRGDLGSLTEVLVVAVGGGGALSVLAGSLQAWLAQPRRSDIKLRLQTRDQVAEIEVKRGDPEAVMRCLLELTRGNDHKPQG